MYQDILVIIFFLAMAYKIIVRIFSHTLICVFLKMHIFGPVMDDSVKTIHAIGLIFGHSLMYLLLFDAK